MEKDTDDTVEKERIVITGTGRAGTTFLVQLLSALGEDTGFAADGGEGYFPEARAGLERHLKERNLPRIVKGPHFCDQIDDMLARGYVIGHVIVPVRDFEEAAASRAFVQAETTGRSSLSGSAVPGGLWDAETPQSQEGILRHKFATLVESLVRNDIPTTFLSFPRFVQDPGYLYGKLKEAFPSLDEAAFDAAFEATAKSHLIHDFSDAPAAGGVMEQLPTQSDRRVEPVPSARVHSMPEMYRRPYVTGIDWQVLSMHQVPLERLLSSYGNNFGNMLFSEALYRSLDNAKRGSLHFAPADLQDCDVIVVCAANWLNPHSDFGDFAARLERTGLPVVIAGIGAQSTTARDIPSLKDGTLRLVRLAAERSAAISTRGGFSSKVLAHYGIRNSFATGCPSMLLNGETTVKIRDVSGFAMQDCAIHSTRHLFNKADKFQADLYRNAIRNGLDLILQSELADMYYALGRTNNPDILKRCDGVLADVYGVSARTASQYLSAHGKVFVGFEQWIAGLRKKRFSAGTRLHGTVASLLAGTPAVLISHDSRTWETAQAMDLPTVKAEDVSLGSDFDVRSLYSDAAMARYVDGYERYLYNFKAFFRMNGLRPSRLIDADAGRDVAPNAVAATA